MRKLFRLFVLVTMVATLFLFAGCIKDDEKGYGDVAYKNKELNDRNEVIIRFGADALYPPDGFGNNKYILVYSSRDVGKVKEIAYDPYIKAYHIYEIKNGIDKRIICDKRKPEMRELDYPCVDGTFGIEAYFDRIYINDIPIFLAYADKNKCMECSFGYFDTYYTIIFENYEIAWDDLCDGVQVEEFYNGEPVELIREMLNSHNK